MMADILPPREGSKFISEHSQDVSIVVDGVNNTAKKVFELMKAEPHSLSVDRWVTHKLNPTTADAAAVDWVFVSDLLNFSFWSDDESKKYMVHYKDTDWTGYWTLCACMNRALDEGIAITDPKYYATVTRDQLAHILRSDSAVDMPMLEERLDSLHQAGTVLNEKYGGTFANVITASDHSAQALIRRVVDDFPTFKDQAQFQGKTVAIHKRVQILVGDVWAACGGQGLGLFNDIDTITMFADYRIPQALVWFGALKYSDQLMEKLKKGVMLPNGDRQEVEIRGCSIWAVELLVEEVNKLIQEDPDLDKATKVNAITLDHYLWDYRREHADEVRHIPIHKTRSVYY